jgi:hypothetical protein
MSKESAFHEKYKPKLISCKQQKHTKKTTKHKEVESDSPNSHDTNYPLLWHFLPVTFDEVSHPAF